MPIADKPTLKSYFQTGDRPTEANFSDLIDSLADVSSVFTKGGNAFGANSILGSMDNYDLLFYTNNLERLRIRNDGTLAFGNGSSVFARIDSNGSAWFPSVGRMAKTGTNVGGDNFVIQSGLGTGTGTVSNITLAGAIAAASGTTPQTYQNIATFDTVKVAVLNTTTSTSASSGALTVAGGAGIAGALYTGGGINLSGTRTILSTSASGSITIGGDVSVNTGASLKVNGSTNTIASTGTLLSGSTVMLQWDGAGVKVPGLATGSVLVTSGSSYLNASSVTATELGYLSGVTSSIQTQLNGKQSVLGYTPVNRAGDTMTGDLAFASGKGIRDANNVYLLNFTSVGSAVNYFTAGNSVTAVNPTISAAGSDTNIGIDMVPKGTGNFRVMYGGTAALAVSSGTLAFNTSLILGAASGTGGVTFQNGPSGQGAGYTGMILQGRRSDAISGSNVNLSLAQDFAPASGAATSIQLLINPIHNQTGTASGTVRGIYYNPTNTRIIGAHYAIETTSGNLLFGGNPTIIAGGMTITASTNPTIAVGNLTIATSGNPSFSSTTGLVYSAAAGASHAFAVGTANGSNTPFTPVSVTASYTPTTSGTGSFRTVSITPTYNQTGTASQTIHGIYYNPTVANVLGAHYAFESTSGDVMIGGTGVLKMNAAGTPKEALSFTSANVLQIGGSGSATSLLVVPGTIGRNASLGIQASAGILALLGSLGVDIGTTNITATTGSRYSVKVFDNFTVSSGAATYTGLQFSGTISQTGTASGTVRGIYYNPTISSVLGAHYAFEATSGIVKIGSTEVSTSATTGSLINAGGFGNAGAMYVGGLATLSAGADILGGFSVKRTAVADAAYTILATDCLVAYTSLSATRTATLPASLGPRNYAFTVKDETGSAGTNNIVVAAPSGTTIDGAASKTISSNYGSLEIYWNGTNFFTR